MWLAIMGLSLCLCAAEQYVLLFLVVKIRTAVIET